MAQRVSRPSPQHSVLSSYNWFAVPVLNETLNPEGHNKQLDAIAQVRVKVERCTKIDERPNSVSIGLYLPMYIK